MRRNQTVGDAQRIVSGEPVACPGCARSFLRHHRGRIYCCPSCRWRAARVRRAAAGLPVRGCAECRRRAGEINRLQAELAEIQTARGRR